MYRLFCCRNRKTSRVEIDEITDSLESCLSLETGVNQFRTFLRQHKFDAESITLDFVLKCSKILSDISRLSPETRVRGLPIVIQNDIKEAYRLAENINFTVDQMNFLDDRLSNPNSSETQKNIETARDWAMDLLRDIYKTFRVKPLEEYDARMRARERPNYNDPNFPG